MALRARAVSSLPLVRVDAETIPVHFALVNQHACPATNSVSASFTRLRINERKEFSP